jgi:hypothetical protein
MSDVREPNDDLLVAPIDLSSLGPHRDGAAFDAIVRSIATDAIAERRHQRSVLAPLVAWSRPALAAAAVVLVVAGSTLALVHPPSPMESVAGAEAAPPGSLAESAGIPGSLVAFATTTRPMTTAELAAAFETIATSDRPR